MSPLLHRFYDLKLMISIEFVCILSNNIFISNSRKGQRLIINFLKLCEKRDQDQWTYLPGCMDINRLSGYFYLLSYPSSDWLLLSLVWTLRWLATSISYLSTDRLLLFLVWTLIGYLYLFFELWLATSERWLANSISYLSSDWILLSLVWTLIG